MSATPAALIAQAADMQSQGDPGGKQCDEEALRKAKADRDKWLKIYQEQRAAADDTRQREADALAAAEKEFNKYAQGIAEKGVVTVGKQTFRVPDQVVAAWKVAKVASSDSAASEKFLKLTKMYLEELAKSEGYKNALDRAKWIDAALSGLAMDAKVLTSLKEAEFHAEQAYKQWLAAYESLMKARLAEDKVKRLEAACQKVSADKCIGLGCETQPSPTGCIGWGCDEKTQGADNAKSSGQREAEEAQRMIDQWKKVEGGFEDAEGNFHDTDSAFNEALAVVQGQQSIWFLVRPAFAAEPDYRQEWNRFRQPMIRAYQRLARALEAYRRAEAAFRLIPKKR